MVCKSIPHDYVFWLCGILFQNFFCCWNITFDILLDSLTIRPWRDHGSDRNGSDRLLWLICSWHSVFLGTSSSGSIFFFKTIKNSNLGYVEVRNYLNHDIQRKSNLCGAWGHTPLIRSQLPTLDLESQSLSQSYVALLGTLPQHSTYEVCPHTLHNHLILAGFLLVPFLSFQNT